MKSGNLTQLNYVEVHIYQTREAKAFALLSEEGIAKGVGRITAVTSDFAFEAMKRADLLDQEADLLDQEADLLGQEVTNASKDDIVTLEKKVAALKSSVEQASIPAARKADIKKKICVQAKVTKAKKKIQAENLTKAVKVATEEAEVAAKEGKVFSVSYLDVGLDAAAAHEAVQKAVQKGIPVMVFSKDKAANKALVYAGVPPKVDKYIESDLHEWLTSALEPLKGNGGKPKNGLCSGQGKDASGLEEAMNVAKKFAALKLS